jgi:nucleotide-binding universal stress UspA family protein
MKKKSVILVPVDFTKICDRAVRQAHLISKALSCDMVLFHVIEKSTGWVRFFYKEKDQLDIGSVTKKLKALRVRAEKYSGQRVTTEVVRGIPYKKILQRAAELDAEFMILGIREDNSGSDDNHDVGDNVSKVVASSICPVITVSNKLTCHNLREILLPLDLTRETRQKVTNAIHIAHRFRAKIRVMSAVLQRNGTVEINRLTSQINQVVDFINKAGIPCEGELAESSSDSRSAVPIILKYVKEHRKIDMIIMTRSETDLLDFIITPQALELLKRSPYPVMYVKEQALETTWISH